jgi:thiamine phosphate synthase YjbQ (UPF0047 family)
MKAHSQKTLLNTAITLPIIKELLAVGSRKKIGMRKAG